MPGRDGTGPAGAGSMTGRGLGFCSDRQFYKRNAGRGQGLGPGLACRRGFGGGFGRGCASFQDSDKTPKERLQEQKEFLKSRLDEISQQLEDS